MEPLRIRVALFTAAPFSVKSFLVKKITENKENRLPVLDYDSEVFSRCFKILNCPELITKIKLQNAWGHLRKKFDFDRLFRLHHRDWYARVGMPPAFVAVGWIYCFQEWREQVRNGFRQLAERQFDFHLFVLRLSFEDFFLRYKCGVRDRCGTSHQFCQLHEDEQRKWADNEYQDFLENDLHIPEANEMDCMQLENNEDLLKHIKIFCQG